MHVEVSDQGGLRGWGVLRACRGAACARRCTHSVPTKHPMPPPPPRDLLPREEGAPGVAPLPPAPPSSSAMDRPRLSRPPVAVSLVKLRAGDGGGWGDRQHAVDAGRGHNPRPHPQPQPCLDGDLRPAPSPFTPCATRAHAAQQPQMEPHFWPVPVPCPMEQYHPHVAPLLVSTSTMSHGAVPSPWNLTSGQ